MQREETHLSAVGARVRVAARARRRARRAASWRACAVLGAALAGALLVGPDDARAVARFGTRCQADFQIDWEDTPPSMWQDYLPYMWERCQWFVDELNDTDTSVFYFNLTNSKSRYSTCDSCGTGVDDVALMYTGTHGGAYESPNVLLAMWEQDVFALSVTDGWRYGDEATRCSIFAQYACETLTAGDSVGQMIDRWRGTFRGGLRMALGSHGTLWDSVTTNECGEDFADDLQAGKTLKWAWFDGNDDAYSDQDVKVLATGTGSSDSAAKSNCKIRRDWMMWQNFGDWPRLRDGDVDWFCSSRISNN
ncbi:MAG TPA: DUF6345 domain-containing protein [Pyrinomonadaceae bacterium]|nr:DUF6345 domain-containing protein [Pyrinomonadaceae bacterium]